MFFLFFKMFKRFEKVVQGGKNGVKMGKNGVKRLTQNPHIYTTDIVCKLVPSLFSSPIFLYHFSNAFA